MQGFRHSRISGPHKPDQRNRKQQHNKSNNSSFFNKQNDISKRKKSYCPEKCSPFIEGLLRYYNQLSTSQKIVCLISLGVISGLSFYMILQLMTNADLRVESSKNFSTNRLSAEEKNALSSQKNSHKIQIDPNVEEYLNQPYYRQHTKQAFEMRNQLQEFRGDIIKAVAAGTVSKLQKEVLDQPDLKIYITLPSVIEGSKGRFVGETNTIYFAAMKPYFDKNRSPIMALLNEYHHAQIALRNKKIGCETGDNLRNSEPYCDNNVFDQQKVNELNVAIKEDFKKIQFFESLINKIAQGIPLSEMEKSDFNQFENSLKNFHPFTNKIEYPSQYFYSEIQSLLKPYDDKNNNFDYFISEENLEKQTPFRPDVKMYVKIEAIGDKVSMAFQYGLEDSVLEKAKSFFTSLKIQHSAIYAAKGYKNSYDDITPASKLAELASFIDQYPSEVKQFFFENFCKYFSDYHEINYCEHDDPITFIR